MMQKYEKLGFSIMVDLHQGGYLARADILKIGGRESNEFDVMLELRRSDIPKWDMIDEEHFKIESDNINTSVRDFIIQKQKEGYFAHPMLRYEYELKCFEKGNEMFEGVSMMEAIKDGKG